MSQRRRSPIALFCTLLASAACASESAGGDGPLAGGGTTGGSSVVTGGTAGSAANGGGPVGGAAATSGTGASGGAVAGGGAGASSTGGVSTGGSGGATAGVNGGGASGFAGLGGDAGAAGSIGGRGGAAGAGGKGGFGGASGGAGKSGFGGSGGAVALTKFAGNITTRSQVRSDFVTFWNQITPENEGKWGSIEGQRDRMNWTGMDRVRDYAREHNIPYKGHTLVWGAQQPSWLNGLSQSEQRAEVEEWIQLFCERYPDVALIDVVNEPPPHTTPPYVAALGGAGSSGYDWIAQAFRWARQYCPNAILLLNDYNNVEYQNDNNRTIDMVNRIKAAGAPIDAVGCQSHAAANVSTTTVEGFINRITSMTGLPVYISEYDINVADDNRQRDIMQSQFTMFWNNPNVKGITIWGYISGSTWVANSGLMSSSGQQRPAMVWLMDFLGR